MHKVVIKAENIKKSLPHGAIGEIARLAKVSRDTVQNVLSGKSQNLKALKAIKTYLDDLKATKDAIANTVDSLDIEKPI
ncbi:hypothetical protein [Paraflavitalea speifideaquila]|uniref:hypothetical protein n=1 Tax=Paraflavitalea speifideaquila TaxID=3076558 RepID=UPI0028E6B412|nr:hypothetical protein [Paraflavitalea speifideiaquila]